MRFRVDGADAKTGNDVQIEIDADDETAAATLARSRGVLASSVRRAVEVVGYSSNTRSRDAVAEIDRRDAMAELERVEWSYASPRDKSTTFICLVVSFILWMSGLAATAGGVLSGAGLIAIVGLLAIIAATLLGMIREIIKTRASIRYTGRFASHLADTSRG